MIEGISHVTFIVRDLEQMAAFLTTVFGAEEVYSSGDATFSNVTRIQVVALASEKSATIGSFSGGIAGRGVIAG